MTIDRTLFLLALAAFALAGCEQKAGLDAPRKFFSQNKIGSSPDFGIIKWNNPTDHVVSVHGSMDDMETCRIVADALNQDACSETGGEDCLNPFSCQPLNH